jgi:hypothetical protein
VRAHASVRLVALGLIGCGSVKGAQSIDAGPLDAAVPDAISGPCDLASAFANPALVPGATSVGGATVSYDELVIYFSVSQNQSITTFRAARAARTGAFPVGAAAPGVPDLVIGPSANESETVLYLQSGQGELLRMTRALDGRLGHPHQPRHRRSSAVRRCTSPPAATSRSRRSSTERRVPPPASILWPPR